VSGSVTPEKLNVTSLARPLKHVFDDV